jgi:cytoskeletal protein CcmA (bactofilin family)
MSKKIGFGLILWMISSVAAVTVAGPSENAPEPGEHQVMILPAGKVINGDYFAYGERVEISGTVNGDVYALGGQVLVDGEVNGDLLVAGGTVIVSGKISQDARIMGGQVTVNGAIERNLTVAGGNVNLTNTASVQGGVVAAGGTIVLAVPVGKDVRVAAGNLTVSDMIDGNLHVAAGQLRLTSKAAVGGNLTYWSGHPASIDENAKVAGIISKKIPKEGIRNSAEKMAGMVAGFILLAKIIGFFSTLLMGLVLIYFVPNYSRDVVSTLRDKPLASLGLGFLTVLATPVMIVFLLVTVVGIPLALLLSALYLIGIYLARILAIFWIGSALLGLFGKTVGEGWALVLGLIVYSVLTLLPFIGGLVAVLAVLFGLGASLLADRQFYLAARKKEMI